MLILSRIALTAVIVLSLTQGFAQRQDADGLYAKVYRLPDKLFGAIHKNSLSLQQKLESSTQKYLDKLERRERKLQRRLARKDSAAAAEIFGNLDKTYSELSDRISDSSKHNQGLRHTYSPRLDSMKSVFGFLQANQLLSQEPAAQEKLQGALKDYAQLQQKFSQSEALRKSITARKEYLAQRLEPFGMAKSFNKYKAQIYYYRQQMDEYKNILEQPEKLQAKLLSAASHLPAFQSFFNRYSQLGQLFRLPNVGDMASVDIPGLQTRDLLMRELGQRFGAGFSPNQSIGQGVLDAAAQGEQLKKKINELGANGADLDMPDFKKNEERIKTFAQRLELGTNLQSTKSNNFFPNITDVSLSLGYKASQNAVAGLGLGYRLGLGRDIRHIRLTHEGVNFRSFVDIKMKGSFWITGGGELNYRSSFKDFSILQDLSPWQKSTLVGITKKYQLKKMKGNIQILYDFLHRQQVPVTQPVVFRVGYML
ncbi:MAG TPA: hypothetical protein PK339_05760 [Flavitalea sp.]|nr:hypothetical protein [Flavitalea sp.]